MAKELTKFQFTNTRSTINYDPSWFVVGKIHELTESDLGPYTEKGPTCKLQSLKKHAWDNYGVLLRGQATEKGTLVIQALAAPKEAK